MPTGPTVLAIDPSPKNMAVVELNMDNSFPSGGEDDSYYLRTAWIGTDTDNTLPFSVSFATLQTSTHQPEILNVVTRQALIPGKTKGFVVDVLLQQPLGKGEAISLCVGQTGASDYFEPEVIEDIVTYPRAKLAE